MRRIQKISLIALSLALLIGTTSCDKASDTRVIKLAHGLDVTHPVHKAMVFMG